MCDTDDLYELWLCFMLINFINVKYDEDNKHVLSANGDNIGVLQMTE